MESPPSRLWRMTTEDPMRWMLAALALALATPALAYPPARAQVATDRAQQRDNHRELRDDLSDLSTLQAIVHDWNRARRYGDRHLERRADSALRTYLERELAEARVEYREDTREYQGASREARRSHSRDDAYDRADDRRDMLSSRRDLARLDALARELRAMQRAFDQGWASPRDYRDKARLLAELESMARAEVVADKQEIREDRAEYREDTYYAYGGAHHARRP